MRVRALALWRTLLHAVFHNPRRRRLVHALYLPHVRIGVQETARFACEMSMHVIGAQ
jgi:hypothetical protein